MSVASILEAVKEFIAGVFRGEDIFIMFYCIGLCAFSSFSLAFSLSLFHSFSLSLLFFSFSLAFSFPFSFSFSFAFAFAFSFSFSFSLFLFLFLFLFPFPFSLCLFRFLFHFSFSLFAISFFLSFSLCFFLPSFRAPRTGEIYDMCTSVTNEKTRTLNSVKLYKFRLRSSFGGFAPPPTKGRSRSPARCRPLLAKSTLRRGPPCVSPSVRCDGSICCCRA